MQNDVITNDLSIPKELSEFMDIHLMTFVSALGGVGSISLPQNELRKTCLGE
jgi:hypothetical protein